MHLGELFQYLKEKALSHDYKAYHSHLMNLEYWFTQGQWSLQIVVEDDMSLTCSTYKSDKWTTPVPIKFSSLPTIFNGVYKETDLKERVGAAGADFWQFCSQMMKEYSPVKYPISRVEGEDIRKFYLETCYDADQRLGTLAGSCMRYVACQPWLDMYCTSANCSLLVVPSPTQPGKIIGRALLWTLIDGRILLDRQYGNESVIGALRAMAKKEGWLWWGGKGRIQGPGNKVHPSGSLDKVGSCIAEVGKGVGARGYPYLDTLKYYQPETGLLSSYELYDDGWQAPSNVYVLTGASGGWYSHIQLGIDCVDGKVIPCTPGHVLQLYDGRYTIHRDKLVEIANAGGRTWALLSECFEVQKGRWALLSDQPNYIQYEGWWYRKTQCVDGKDVLSTNGVEGLIPYTMTVETTGGHLALKKECRWIMGRWVHESETLRAIHLVTGEEVDADLDSTTTVGENILVCYPGRVYIRGGILVEKGVDLSKRPVEVKYLDVFLDRTGLPEVLLDGELPWLEEAIQNEPKKWQFITSRQDYQSRGIRNASTPQHETAGAVA